MHLLRTIIHRGQHFPFAKSEKRRKKVNMVCLDVLGGLELFFDVLGGLELFFSGQKRLRVRGPQ